MFRGPRALRVYTNPNRESASNRTFSSHGRRGEAHAGGGCSGNVLARRRRKREATHAQSYTSCGRYCRPALNRDSKLLPVGRGEYCMAPGNLRDEMGQNELPSAKTPSVTPEYKPTLVDSSFFLVSLIRQIRERISEPARDAVIGVPVNYDRRKAMLPVSEMLPWFRDLPSQVRAMFERPTSPRVPITSQPIPVREIWQDFEQHPVSWLNSALVHGLVILALTLP